MKEERGSKGIKGFNEENAGLGGNQEDSGA